MPKPETLKRAIELKLDRTAVLDIVQATMIGIRFDKVFYRDKSIEYYVNGQKCSGFNFSFSGKNKEELYISIIQDTKINEKPRLNPTSQG